MEDFIFCAVFAIIWYFFVITILGYPVGNYMFKVNNRNARTRCEIYSKLTITTPSSSVSINNFERVSVGWVVYKLFRIVLQTNQASFCF